MVEATKSQYKDRLWTREQWRIVAIFTIYHNSLDHYTYCSLLYKYYSLESQYVLYYISFSRIPVSSLNIKNDIDKKRLIS